jgi:hypothetical protein
MQRDASRKDTSGVTLPETYFHPAARAGVRLSANPSLSQSISLKEPTTALSCWIPCGSKACRDSVLRKLAARSRKQPRLIPRGERCEQYCSSFQPPLIEFLGRSAQYIETPPFGFFVLSVSYFLLAHRPRIKCCR